MREWQITWPWRVALLTIFTCLVLLLLSNNADWSNRSSWAESCHCLDGSLSGAIHGSHQRVINRPQDSTPDTGFRYSLSEEAHYLTKVSPYLRVRITETSEVQLYGISMYHQLHCLDSLRDSVTGAGGHHHNESLVEHLVHCIDYISQAVVCAVDDTIERAVQGKTVNGAGSTHNCRNSELVRNVVERSVAEPLAVAVVRPGDTVSSLWAQLQVKAGG
ncbi:protein of unknown function (DUF3328) domain containing protein [Naviculisporaceae sp. PSN 640]